MKQGKKPRLLLTSVGRMSHSLFRKEALDAKRGSWLGRISLSQPLPLWVLTGGAVLAALLIGLFLSFGTYTRRSTVTGQLVPGKGLATVLSPATGIVERLHSAEGQRIAAGQPLAVVGVPRATPEGGDTQAALEARLQDRRDGAVSLQTAQQAQLQAQADGLRATGRGSARTDADRSRSGHPPAAGAYRWGNPCPPEAVGRQSLHQPAADQAAGVQCAGLRRASADP